MTEKQNDMVERCRWIARTHGVIQVHARTNDYWCQTVSEPCFFLPCRNVMIAAGRFDLSLEVILTPNLQPTKNFNPIIITNAMGDVTRFHDEWKLAVDYINKLGRLSI